MTLSVERIEKVQLINREGAVVYSVCNTAGQGTGALTMNTAPEQNPVITEAVRKTVNDYGETLRKLSNE